MVLVSCLLGRISNLLHFFPSPVFASGFSVGLDSSALTDSARGRQERQWILGLISAFPSSSKKSGCLHSLPSFQFGLNLHHRTKMYADTSKML